MDLSKTFVREFYLDSSHSLSIHQVSVGDVGCVVWDAALVLANYLISASGAPGYHQLLLKESSVIELGSGTALTGITAAFLGAHVVVTDLKEFLPLMQKNIDSNQHAIKGSVQAQALGWGSEVGHLPKPQYILVSDCLYYSESLKPLVKTLCDLSSSYTKILFCYEQRDSQQKQELEAKFFQLIEEHFIVYKVPLEQFHPDFRSPDIHILIFQKNTCVS